MKKSFSFSDSTPANYMLKPRRPRHGLWFVLAGALGLCIFAVVAENLFRTRIGAKPSAEVVTSTSTDAADLRPLLFNPVAASTQPPSRRDTRSDPVVISNCRLGVIHKQDVPSQREGVLLWIGTEVSAKEPVAEDRLLELKVAGESHRIRLLKEGDIVQAGQLLAQLDDRLARADLRIRQAKLLAAQADLSASERVFEEAKNRQQTQERLYSQVRATAAEEVRAAKLATDRSRYEMLSKKQAVALAQVEYQQAETVLALYQVRSSIPGMVKTVYRQAGESIRNLEPVVQVWSLARLRVEGQVDVQYLPQLRSGMTVALEPILTESPRQTFVGHLQKITGVAVSKGPDNPRIVSASEDGTVRVWDRSTGHECGVWKHGIPVRAVACMPPGGTDNLCLSGTADGKGWLRNLDESDGPARQLQGRHQGAIGCVAFSPDGKYCVTGGDDRAILLWETSAGTLRYRFPEGHRAAITSLQFTPRGQLLSASRDNTLRLWDVGEQEARERAVFDRRAGDVTVVGASPDGRTVLFDQGQTLRLLSLPRGLTEGVLQHPSSATRFAGLALYSPNGQTILTTSNGDGGVQLWQPPTSRTRGHVRCRLVGREEGETTCAAFAPSGGFLVTGTRNHHVLVWTLPAAAERDSRLAAKLTLIEQALDTSTRQVRVRAELNNPDIRLLPGTTVTMTIYPR